MTTPRAFWEPRGGTVAEQMASEVACAIIAREYEAGSILTEAELARRTGVSRTPAREAMLQLSQWGLVRLLPKKGAIVTTVDPDKRRQLVEVRAVFETFAVRSMPHQPGVLEALSDVLEGYIETQRAALITGDTFAFAIADYEFHARIILSSGNTIVKDMLESLAPRLVRLSFLAEAENTARRYTMISEHVELADYARTGDVNAFSDLLQRHIRAGHFPAVMA